MAGIDADKTALSYIINNLDNCALDEVSPGNTDKLGELKQKAESVYQKSDASQEEVDAVINEVNEYILSLNYSYETQIISGNKFVKNDSIYYQKCFYHIYSKHKRSTSGRYLHKLCCRQNDSN